MGDVELVAAFYHLVLPIARQFAPDMVKGNPVYAISTSTKTLL